MIEFSKHLNTGLLSMNVEEIEIFGGWKTTTNYGLLYAHLYNTGTLTEIKRSKT